MRAFVRFLLSLVAGYFLAVFVLSFVYLVIPPVSTVMVASFLRGDGMKREWVSMRHISPQLARAVVTSEDGRFCEHYGIDWHAVDKAVTQAERRNRAPRGASTISMQVAKNLFLWNGRSWLRKALEAPIALWLDFAWPKRRMLEVYLNIAQWGDGVFGAEAASKRAYGVSAAALTPYQAAMLAVVLPDPDRRSAARPGPAMRGMAATVQARMSGEPRIAACAGR